jgi:TPR repeat protein/Zn-dependent protease
MELFITKLFEQPAFYISTVASFAGSICVHEYCHAFVAHHLGDDTAKEGGFMTLNPLKVMGWMSIAALLIFGFSWGAVPVKQEDPSRLRRSAISLAGPLSNLALLGIVALFLKGLYVVAPTAVAGGFIYYCRLFLICALYANAILFLFNILPIPVLDGWGIIEPFLPKFLIPSEESKSSIFKLFIYIVCFSSASGLFDKALEIFASQFLPSQVSAMPLAADGTKCLEAEDYSGAYKAFTEAAEQGSPEGKLYLALCIIEGYGCESNPEKAFSLFSEKDVCIFPLAKFYLGWMRMNGVGCSQDYVKAYDYLSQKDVQQGFPLAKANLGILLAEGFGVKQDLSKAFTLLNDEEVMKLSPVARFYVSIFLMGGEVCKKDEQRAFSLMNDEEVLKAQPQAKYLLGSWYYAGDGTKQDFAKAAQLLKDAADAGEPNAAHFLGYQNGKMPDYGISLEELLKRYWNANK